MLAPSGEGNTNPMMEWGEMSNMSGTLMDEAMFKERLFSTVTILHAPGSLQSNLQLSFKRQGQCMPSKDVQ